MTNIIFCSYNSDFLPYKTTQWAVCYDLKVTEDCIVAPWKVILAPTWVKSALPIWRWIKIYARSSLPVKYWVFVVNSVWIIDSDYRWELKVELSSLSGNVEIKAWTRIAQLEILPYYIEWKAFPISETPSLEMIANSEIYENFEKYYPSDRGEWWFWSTNP